MSRTTLIALLLGLLLVATPFVRADDEYEGEDDEAEAEGSKDDAEKDVLVLTEKNFDATIKKHKFVLAEFYAPWCGHCKNLAPHYAKAATALKSHDADVVLGKIDATVEKDLATKYGVKGYPTLKWIVDGEDTEYNGPREAEGIINWVKRKTGPPTTVVDTDAKLTALEKEHEVILVGYFKKAEGADYETFKKLGSKSEDVTFVETTVAAVGKVAGLTKPGFAAIKNFKGEDRTTAVFSGSVSDDLKDFIKAEKMPTTIAFDRESGDKIFNSGIDKQLILWASAEELAQDSDVFKAYVATAKKYKGKLVFVTVDNTGADHEPVTNYFGLKEAKSPVLLGFFMEKNKKYKLAKEYNAANVEEFAKGVIAGTAPVEYKSSPIPENDKDGEVQIVVGKTVDSIVFDEKRDVLIEVYAPWCGHCKQLEPIYKKLAKRFKKVDSVVIAKMDGTENEHPELEVKGFPTIYFVPAEKGAKPIPFEGGDRTLKGLTKFIKKHAKVEYTLPKKDGKDDDEKEEKEEKGSEKDEL